MPLGHVDHREASGRAGPVAFVLLVSAETGDTGFRGQEPGAYDMNAAFMLLELHGWDIHVVQEYDFFMIVKGF
jgi:hypothetical protein